LVWLTGETGRISWPSKKSGAAATHTARSNDLGRVFNTSQPNI
jgi:hypothetical protein